MKGQPPWFWMGAHGNWAVFQINGDSGLLEAYFSFLIAEKNEGNKMG